MLRVVPAAVCLTAVTLLAGCTTVPGDLGRAKVGRLLAERGREVAPGAAAPPAADAGLPDADSAVRAALLGNPDLRAAYARLGVAAADLYAAGRVRNPVLSLAVLDPSARGRRDQITLGLVASFTDALTLPLRSRMATAAFEQTQRELAAEVLRVAADTEAAFHRAVGARNVAALREQVAEAASLSAALADRFFEAGNLTPRERALERAAASELRIAAIEARQRAADARVALAALLGRDTGAGWTLPDALNAPPAGDPPVAALLAIAARSRLDVEAATLAVRQHTERVRLTRGTRWLGDVEIGAERERETDGSFLTGPVASLELPLFGTNRDRLLRADAALASAVAQLERVRLDAVNAVRLAHTALTAARARVDEYRAHLLPQREEAVARAQQEQNYMLIGVFELLVSRQRAYDAWQGYVESVQDYWVARAGLTRAVGTTLPDEPATLRPLESPAPRKDARATDPHHHHARPGQGPHDNGRHPGHGEPR